MEQAPIEKLLSKFRNMAPSTVATITLKLQERLGPHYEDFRQIVAEYGGAVAGGFIRDSVNGTTPKDIDVFFPSAACRDLAVSDFKKVASLDPVPSPHSINFVVRKDAKDPSICVQFIFKALWVDLEELLQRFDFICCAAALVPHVDQSWNGKEHKWFLWSANGKTLEVLNPDCLSVRRCFRMIAKGFITYDDKEIISKLQSSPNVWGDAES